MDNSLAAVVTLQCNSKTSTIMESKNYYDPHRSYPVGRCLTIVIAHPEILDTPLPEVGEQYIALAPPEQTPPTLEPCTQATPRAQENSLPDVGAQYIAPAQSALTSPTQSEPTPDACPQSTDPAQATSPAVGTLFKASAQPELTFSKPRRGAFMFSPMWSAAEHGVSIQAKENEPRRGGIVLPSKSTAARPLRLATHPRAAHPPIRGAPS